MKSIKIDLGRELDKIKITIMGDPHIGDKYCDMKMLKKIIDDIKNDKELYVILNGDILNNAIKSSVSDIYSEKLSPEQQLDLAVDLFKPISHKILCINTGNHERRTYKETGIDISRLFSYKLGIEDRYSGIGALLFIRFGANKIGIRESNGSGYRRKTLYTIYATHGSRGGRTEGNKLKSLIDLKNIVTGADIYVQSHTHLKNVYWGSNNIIDTRNSNVISTPVMYVSNGALLDYGGYSEIGSYSPQAKGSPIIILDGTKKFFDSVGDYDTFKNMGT